MRALLRTGLRQARACLGMASIALACLMPAAGYAAAAKAEPAILPSATLGPSLDLFIGKSSLLRLPESVARISVGNPAVADVTLIGPKELYLLGKTPGTTNVIVWARNGPTTIVDVAVQIDVQPLRSRLRELLPEERGLQVSIAADSFVLSGPVSSAVAADQAVTLAEAYVRNLNRGLVLPVVAGAGGAAPGTSITVGETRSPGATVAAAGSRVVNMLTVDAPQQVMLEVKVAEVSKTLLDKLGAEFNMSRSNGDWTYSLLADFLTQSAGTLGAAKSATKRITLDAETKDGLIKILAEPNIVAISGQEGSFLAGGRIFIPVARSNAATGLSTITLEEKEFGVGLKVTPTVLHGGRINLKVAPEVSELSQTGSPFTTVDGTTAVLPSFTTRRAQTTVQLQDGQSFAIAGLIKNNVAETVKRLPVLGEIPILGALFRSSEFQADKTELMFVITPRLVKPLPPHFALPTDGFTPPTRSEFFLGGKMEGAAAPDGAAEVKP